MRKAFIEPDMKVIKLNLNENIATSGIKEDMAGLGLSFYIKEDNNTIIYTGITMAEAEACLNGDAKTEGSATTFDMSVGQAALVRELGIRFNQDFVACSAM